MPKFCLLCLEVRIRNVNSGWSCGGFRYFYLLRKKKYLNPPHDHPSFVSLFFFSSQRKILAFSQTISVLLNRVLNNDLLWLLLLNACVISHKTSFLCTLNRGAKLFCHFDCIFIEIRPTVSNHILRSVCANSISLEIFLVIQSPLTASIYDDWPLNRALWLLCVVNVHFCLSLPLTVEVHANVDNCLEEILQLQKSARSSKSLWNRIDLHLVDRHTCIL